MQPKVRSPCWFWALCLFLGVFFPLIIPCSVKDSRVLPWQAAQGYAEEPTVMTNAFIHQTLPKNSHWAQKQFSEFDSKTMLSILSPHCTLYFLPFHILGARTALSEGKLTVLCGTPPKTVVVLCSPRRIRRFWFTGGQDQKRELPSVHLLNCRGCCWDLRRAVK